MGEQAKTAKDRLRAATLGAPAIRDSKIVAWNGENFELRRPTLKQQREIDRLSRDKKGKRDDLKATLLGLAECVYVPGTEERVFNPADVEAMTDRGFEDFVGFFVTEFGKLSKEVDPEEIEKN
jgi:hypothetical protein